MLIIERSGLMIALIISIYLFIGLIFTTWFFVTGFSQEGAAKQYVEWYDEAGMPFAIMVSVIAGTGLGLFWPIIICIMLWSKYH